MLTEVDNPSRFASYCAAGFHSSFVSVILIPLNESMPRILLLLPTTTYRAPDFLDAARRMKIEVVAASEKPNVMASRHPESLLTLNFRDIDGSTRRVEEFNQNYPLDAVIPVDDDTAVLAAAFASALSLPHNSVDSALAARNKHLLSELLHRHGLPAPKSRLYWTDQDPEAAAAATDYPCVLKPLFLSASRGVIRADDPASFVSAWKRILLILADPEVAVRGAEAANQIMIQDFVPGIEFALEGLLSRGQFRVLALFDKPDPLDGPFFEETLYITPSRHPDSVQNAIAACVAPATRAIGLQEGPIHAELRVNEKGPWIIELAARSIGGLCSRTLRFGTGLSLEEIILRHALGMEIDHMQRESRAAGVMMIPIPAAGVLREVRGLDAASVVPGVEELTISAHLGKTLIPLPEGSSYLGFIFSRGEDSYFVEKSLRQAHRKLEFVIEPSGTST
jgi:biotin carboxylase